MFKATVLPLNNEHHYCCQHATPIQKMESLHNYNLEELVDILSTQTTLYVQMHMEGGSQTEFQKCCSLVDAVQAEIKSRKESRSKAAQENMGNSCHN